MNKAAQYAAKQFTKNPENTDLVVTQLKDGGMSNEDILTGLSMAAGIWLPTSQATAA